MQDQESKQSDRGISISRLFDAPIELVWEVWTDPEHIKKWWGPNGFTNTISLMDVKAGGKFNLTMHGPDGVDYRNESMYTEVVLHKKLVYEHMTGPKFTATIEFEARGNKTFINWSMVFSTREEFIQTVKTFKADKGLEQNVDKLTHYLQSQINIRKQLKNTKMARVGSYLNFPGNTEEAFNFYKAVFKTEFSGKGLQRFEDVPGPEGMPPMSDEDKKLILHVELPILGGHVLMATDAPESFGFTLNTGNNMHICLEPDSREETRRLFHELSAGGKVTMPLTDMFFGAYFGEFSDKYGINWMVSYTEK